MMIFSLNNADSSRARALVLNPKKSVSELMDNFVYESSNIGEMMMLKLTLWDLMVLSNKMIHAVLHSWSSMVYSWATKHWRSSFYTEFCTWVWEDARRGKAHCSTQKHSTLYNLLSCTGFSYKSRQLFSIKFSLEVSIIFINFLFNFLSSNAWKMIGSVLFQSRKLTIGFSLNKKITSWKPSHLSRGLQSWSLFIKLH